MGGGDPPFHVSALTTTTITPLNHGKVDYSDAHKHKKGCGYKSQTLTEQGVFKTAQ